MLTNMMFYVFMLLQVTMSGTDTDDDTVEVNYENNDHIQMV